MFTICYVLIDDKKLYYSNQLIISIISLRKYNTEKIIILTDEKTLQIIKESNIKNKFIQLKVTFKKVNIPDSFVGANRSRYLKTTFRKYISGNILYIDTDTVIAGKIEEKDFNTDFGMVKDSNIDILGMHHNNIYYPILDSNIKYIKECLYKCGYDILLEDTNSVFYNSGVIWAKDIESVHSFFNNWHEAWKECYEKNSLPDQPSLCYINYKLGGVIKDIPDIYNIQVAFGSGMKFVGDAKIIHYMNANLGTYWLSYKHMMKLNYSDNYIQWIIENPKDAFFTYSLQALLEMNGIPQDIINSNSFRLLCNLYIKHRKTYECIEKTIKKIRKIKTTIGKKNGQ